MKLQSILLIITLIMTSLVSCGKNVSKGNPNNLISPHLRPTKNKKMDPPLKSWQCKRTFGKRVKGLSCKPVNKPKTSA